VRKIRAFGDGNSVILEIPARHFRVGPFAGVAADRWDRLRQNLLAQAVPALLAVLTTLLLGTDHLGLIGLVLRIAAQGTLSAVIQPARLAMIQQMVPREDMGIAVVWAPNRRAGKRSASRRLFSPAAQPPLIVFDGP
jgi:MFS family permease